MRKLMLFLVAVLVFLAPTFVSAQSHSAPRPDQVRLLWRANSVARLGVAGGGYASVVVPSPEYPTIQSAINAIGLDGEIGIDTSAGARLENLRTLPWQNIYFFHYSGYGPALVHGGAGAGLTLAPNSSVTLDWMEISSSGPMAVDVRQGGNLFVYGSVINAPNGNPIVGNGNGSIELYWSDLNGMAAGSAGMFLSNQAPQSWRTGVKLFDVWFRTTEFSIVVQEPSGMPTCDGGQCGIAGDSNLYLGVKHPALTILPVPPPLPPPPPPAPDPGKGGPPPPPSGCPNGKC